eukprot:885090-Alexandrium_andersonii.AAC.1
MQAESDVELPDPVSDDQSQGSTVELPDNHAEGAVLETVFGVTYQVPPPAHVPTQSHHDFAECYSAPRVLPRARVRGMTGS